MNAVEASGWELVKSVMDSGAAESVAPTSMCNQFPLEPSVGSQKGQRYTVANGGTIANRGQRLVKGVTDDGAPIKMQYQVADVTQPLNAVGKVCDQGNVVMFTPTGGVIKNVWSGATTSFGREDWIYILRTWVQGSNVATQGEMPENNSRPSSGFQRQFN